MRLLHGVNVSWDVCCLIDLLKMGAELSKLIDDEGSCDVKSKYADRI